MRKGTKFWCWWLHRHLYYVGAVNGRHKFVDICDKAVILSDKEVSELVRR